MLPFQPNSSPFGQNSNEQQNPFGMQNNQMPNPPNQAGTPFGQSTQPQFGMQNANPVQSKPPSPFNQAPTFGSNFTGNSMGANNTGIGQQSTPFGASTGSLFGQPTASIQPGATAAGGNAPQFGQSGAIPQQPNTASLFGQPTVGSGASQLNQSAPPQFGQSAPPQFNQPTSQFNQPASQFGASTEESKAQFTPGNDSAAGNHSSLISSIKDNSVNLYNLTLQEILDRHTMVLENNIKEFEKDAEQVFERDLQLIQNKNNFMSIQNKIAEENSKLEELNEALDFFEKRLEETESGDQSEMGRVIEDFESICDKFYKKVESFKDEQDEVLDLVNENYEIIDSIDRKLESLAKLRKIK